MKSMVPDDYDDWRAPQAKPDAREEFQAQVRREAREHEDAQFNDDGTPRFGWMPMTHYEEDRMREYDKKQNDAAREAEREKRHQEERQRQRNEDDVMTRMATLDLVNSDNLFKAKTTLCIPIGWFSLSGKWLTQASPIHPALTSTCSTTTSPRRLFAWGGQWFLLGG